MNNFRYILLFFCIICFNSLLSQDYNFTDGPYIIENRVVGRVITNGQERFLDTLYSNFDNVSFRVSDRENRWSINIDNDLLCNVNNDILPSNLSKTKDENIFVVSDSHGDFKQFVKLLEQNGVINSDLTWNFSSNSLVIIGDTFDRGKDVLMLFWYFIWLEREASKAGGRLIYILGNHDNMVLKGDLRYLADRYTTFSDTLNIPYNELFSNNSYIGEWLASKNLIQKVGDNIFVHGGISKEFIDNGYSLNDANNIGRDFLFSNKDLYTDDAKFIFGTNGPLWYRGLVRDDEKYNPISDKSLNEVLKYLKAKRIIVGHTTFEGVQHHHKGRVISVDSKDKSLDIPHLSQGLMLR